MTPTLDGRRALVTGGASGIGLACLQHVAPIEDFPPERFRAMLVLMLETPFLLMRAALPQVDAR
jgi:NAD(P)-dependent dehydrogenase (short-subunit alcohol dehydrogenase family)